MVLVWGNVVAVGRTRSNVFIVVVWCGRGGRASGAVSVGACVPGLGSGFGFGVGGIW